MDLIKSIFTVGFNGRLNQEGNAIALDDLQRQERQGVQEKLEISKVASAVSFIFSVLGIFTAATLAGRVIAAALGAAAYDTYTVSENKLEALNNRAVEIEARKNSASFYEQIFKNTLFAGNVIRRFCNFESAVWLNSASNH